VFNVFMDLPLLTLGKDKSPLIDSNAAMPTRAKQAKAVQAERLSGETLQGDAIVRSHGKMNCERSAEMTDPLHVKGNNGRAGLFFDGLALPVGGY
jgi:hypothetical protein